MSADTVMDDDTFVKRTHAELAALKAQADLILRNRPAGHNCPDNAACTSDALRLIHLRIDDHLNQLDEARILDPLEFPVDES